MDLPLCFLFSQPFLFAARLEGSSVKFYLVIPAKVNVPGSLIQSLSWLDFWLAFFLSVQVCRIGNYSSCFSLNSHGHQKDTSKTVVTDIVATPILRNVFFKGFEVFVGFFLFFSYPPRQWNWDPFHKFIRWAPVLVTRNKSIASYLKDVIRTL